MKSNEEYINDYWDNYNKLSNKGELWRLRFTLEEFILEIEKVRIWGVEARAEKNLILKRSESLIKHNEDGMMVLLLQNAMTYEEVKEQTERIRKHGELCFARDAPRIQERLKLIKTPLSFEDSVFIYQALMRNQIILEMISEDVLNEFNKTNKYEKYIKKKAKEE